jgi:hypothetical protein
MTDQATKFGIEAMARIPLYSMNSEQIEGMYQQVPQLVSLFHEFIFCLFYFLESLMTLDKSGSRIVVLADSNTSDQIAILSKAM